MNNGWIKLHRKLKETSFYKRSYVVHLLVHLLISANREDKKFYWNGKEEIIEKGQILTGRQELSKQTGISQQSIRTGLTILKSTNTITIKSTNKYSVITILNWEEYQDTPTNKTTTILTNNQPTTNQQLTTNNNIKNNKNISKEIVSPQRVFGNYEVNYILNKYKSYTGFTPTDKKPRHVANNMRVKTNNFVKKWKSLKPELSFEGTIDKVFEWYFKRDGLKGESLDPIRRKLNMQIEISTNIFEKELSKLGGGEIK